MKFKKYIAYTTHKIVDKFHVLIYKRENAINIEVQSKILLIVYYVPRPGNRVLHSRVDCRPRRSRVTITVYYYKAPSRRKQNISYYLLLIIQKI